MRMVLALVVALLCVPAFAADHSPWPGQTSGTDRLMAQVRACVYFSGGCTPVQCCCAADQKPSGVDGTRTKLANGNTECTVARCNPCQ